MAAKTKPERAFFGENDQQSNESTEGAPDEVLLNASHPEARKLFDLAIEIKKLKPWRWLEETDLIGIENPDTGEIGFISVMGAIGEYEAVALYFGAEGLYGFIALQQDELSKPDRVLELAQVQVAFSDRNDLEKEDLHLITQFGLKFRGKGAWPQFRSYRGGYLPWFITPDEARFLAYGLSQIIEVATNVRDKAKPFKPTGRVEQGGYLMRVARKGESGLIWEDQVWRIPKPASEPLRASVDASLIESLGRIVKSKLDFEIDLMLVPARIGKSGERPRAAYGLMIADRDSGYIFGFELMSAQDSLAAMYSRIPNEVAKLILQAQIVPTRMVVRSDRLRSVLKPLAQKLNIELLYEDSLPSIDEAIGSMFEWMRTGRL